jgi:hypothetical protein
MQDERPAAGAPRLARSSRLADEFLRHQIGNTLRRQRRAAGERRQQSPARHARACAGASGFLDLVSAAVK